MNNINLKNGELAILADGTTIMNVDTFFDVMNRLNNMSEGETNETIDFDNNIQQDDIELIHPETWDNDAVLCNYDEELDEMDDEFDEMDEEYDSYDDDEDEYEEEDDEEDDENITDAVIRNTLENIIADPKTDLAKEIIKEMSDPDSHIGHFLRDVLLG